jgi:hypothetical protein
VMIMITDQDLVTEESHTANLPHDNI